MNTIDNRYQLLLQDILDNGVEKKDRTGTGTLSVFGRQIRHKMSDGFPLLTTKKMAWKSIVTELLWFLRGDTNIKYLVDNDCHIWDGDTYKNYCKIAGAVGEPDYDVHVDDPNQNCTRLMTQEEFINKIKTDDEFAKKWGELGSIYGKQWRKWELPNYSVEHVEYGFDNDLHIDQIVNLINDLKTNPDSRRLMVNAWNVGELDQMVLPPCHYGFQVYTRELSENERRSIFPELNEMYLEKKNHFEHYDFNGAAFYREKEKSLLETLPTRAISLMWNQRSVDTFLGLPFNIASYGLLLEIIAKTVNMVPDELIGNLGDVHLYSNHVEQAKEQIGRELTLEERIDLASSDIHFDPLEFGVGNRVADRHIHNVCDKYGVPRRTRQPYELPKLYINDEFWNHEYQTIDGWIKSMEIGDFQIENYQSHPTIKAPLSN